MPVRPRSGTDDLHGRGRSRPRCGSRTKSANLFGLDFNSVGNHEFDEGVTELLRMQDGGCHPVDGCQDGTPFGGADFQFLAANVTWKDGSGPILPPYETSSSTGSRWPSSG